MDYSSIPVSSVWLTGIHLCGSSPLQALFAVPLPVHLELTCFFWDPLKKNLDSLEKYKKPEKDLTVPQHEWSAGFISSAELC